MLESRAFFVPPEHPDFTPEQQEAAYAEFAAICRHTLPDPGKRIHSITFTHDGEEWTATVGEILRGIRYKTVRSRGQKIEQRIPISDPATVLAIFPGEPYFVVTSHRFWGNVGSVWENPFMAGRPQSVTYFSP